MIQLECSNCKTLLSIDDAFAGGVCRCQHCGTIQTVPKPGKDAVATADSSSPKALFKRKARIESALNPYSDSLDRAADELGSSAGLSANALANVAGATRKGSSSEDPSGASQAGIPSPRRSQGGVPSPAATREAADSARPAAAKPHFTPTPSKSAAVGAAAPSPSKMPMVIAGGVVAIVAVGALAWFLLLSKPKVQPTEPSGAPGITIGSGNTPTQPPPATPQGAGANDAAHGSICGLPIAADSVIYIVDRSGCTQQAFQQMAEACLKSAETLGGSGRFQITVWNNYQDLTYPAGSLGPASAAELDAARKTIVDTYAGSAEISGVLAKAIALQPAAIVFMSAVDLDESNAQTIRSALKEKNIKFYGIAVGSDLTTERLRTLTSELGGGCKQIDLSAL